MLHQQTSCLEKLGEIQVRNWCRCLASNCGEERLQNSVFVTLHSCYRKWREEKAALLDKMDDDEKDEILEWREKAKKELNDWYERRDELLGKTQTSNRYVASCHRKCFCMANKRSTVYCNQQNIFTHNTVLIVILGQTKKRLCPIAMILPRQAMTGSESAATATLIPREQRITRMYRACVQFSCNLSKRHLKRNSAVFSSVNS